MGCGPFKKSSFSSYDKKGVETIINNAKPIDRIVSKKTSLPNPDPYNWILNDSWESGRHLLVDITYPDCTNYEGRKIMLYKDVTIDQLKAQKTIDPHFSSNKRYHSPIARFEPTKDGWKMAMRFIQFCT